MITKMTKYNFVLMNSGKEEFLEQIRDLGVVDITRSVKPVDGKSEEMMERISRIKSALAAVEKVDWSADPDAEAIAAAAAAAPAREGDLVSLIPSTKSSINALVAKLTDATRERNLLLPWGQFDSEAVKDLAEKGIPLHFYAVTAKKWNPAWLEMWPIEIIHQSDDAVYFVGVGDNDIPANELEAPEHDYLQSEARIDEIKNEIIGLKADLANFKERKGELEEEYSSLMDRLNLYLAGVAGKPAAENKICVFSGFAPQENDEALCKALDKMDVYYMKDEAKLEDNPPIKLKNNKFSSLFETFTGMYGMPVYNEFDLTAILGPFYLLFFAFCMGDAGYGIILMLLSLYLKKHDILNMGLNKHHKLVFFLGLVTFVVGLILGTFFGITLPDQAWVPEWMKKFMVKGTIMGFDAQMVLAVAVGVFHLIVAMTIKAICKTKQTGFRANVSCWGWLLVIVGGIIIAALALLGVMDSSVTKIVIIIVGVLAALSIYVFNTPGRNPLLNIGSGLWETYNMASGLLGDALSYIRLYALGLAGGMLGGAFNNVAGMIKALPVPGVNWLGFILILLLGHALNLAMSCLGAFVHPLRLTFVEFFKNSGYEGKGAKYNPLKSN